MLIAVGGLWVFTNYELMMALFRLDERARAYFAASLANVLLTIALTVWLVVGRDEGARGLLLGNFGASAVVLAALFCVHRDAWSRSCRAARCCGRCCASACRRCRPSSRCTRSTSSTAIVLVRFVGLAEAGLYSLAVKFSQVVTVVVRAFNLAWPPLAYSIRDDDEARRAYSLIVTYYLLLAFTIVLGAVARGALGRAAARGARSSSTPTRRSRWSRPASPCTRSTWCLSVAVGRAGRHRVQLPRHRGGRGRQRRR